MKKNAWVGINRSSPKRPGGPHSRWGMDEMLTAARQYKTRGELYRKHYSLYMSAYSRGLLDQICAHMAPSQKRKKHVITVPNPMSLIAPVFRCKNLHEFAIRFKTNYEAGLRYGYDYTEIFENKDNVKYLQNLIVESAQDVMAKSVNA